MSEPNETTQEAPEGDVQHANEQGAAAGGDQPKSFDVDYVGKLRDEAAANRVARASAEERAEAAIDRLYKSCLELATAGILIDPSDLPGESDDFRGEDGMPSLDKIRDAALALAEAKPHLARPRVPSAQLQGPTGQPPEQVGLGTMLRNAAR